MSDTTTTYWLCLDCDEGGVYEQAMSGGAAEKHTQATGHGTRTSLYPFDDGCLVRMYHKPKKHAGALGTIVQTCGQPVVARRLCEQHYADRLRLLR